MTKKLPFLWAVLICLLALPGIAQAQQNFQPTARSLEAVMLEVKNSRQVWTYMFPADELTEYGFADLKELNASVPGPPIQVYYMGYHVSSGQIETNATEEYLVPLMVNNQARAFLTVAFFEGRYQVVGAGETNLAKDVSGFLSKKRTTPLVWIKNVNHSADFVGERGTSLDAAAMLFTPLFTAKRAGFSAPLAYRELVNRFQAMPVLFD